MVKFPFTRDVWKYLLKDLKFMKKWDFGKLSESFNTWIKKKDNWLELPCYNYWEIWRQKNLIIF